MNRRDAFESMTGERIKQRKRGLLQGAAIAIIVWLACVVTLAMLAARAF